MKGRFTCHGLRDVGALFRLASVRLSPFGGHSTHNIIES